jgi:hypothetical protein
MIDGMDVTKLEDFLASLEADPGALQRAKEMKDRFVIVSKAEINKILKLNAFLETYTSKNRL